jgi:hypothetical protein
MKRIMRIESRLQVAAYRLQNSDLLQPATWNLQPDFNKGFYAIRYNLASYPKAANAENRYK